MKKTMLITITLAAVIMMSACSKAKVEKQPVKIPDTSQLNMNDAATAPSENEQQQSPAKEAPETLEDALLSVQREGTEETIPGKLYKSGLGYEIIYPNNFQRTTEGNADSFAADNKDPALYPYVYVNISKPEGDSAADYAGKLTAELKGSSAYQSVETTNNEKIGDQYNAIKITAQAGNEWNSVIRNYYVTESSDTVYQIETQYFLEAEEGYGSTMKAMLSTFFIE